MPTLPLTEHDRLKKDLLALDYDVFVHVVGMVLMGYEASIYDLYHVTKAITGYRLPDRTETTIAVLTKRAFVHLSWRSARLDVKYREAAFFAAAELKPGHIQQLVDAVNQVRNYTPGDETITRHGLRLGQIWMRALHKILLNRPAEFRTLYGVLQDEGRPGAMRLHGLQQIEQLFGRLDWNFWQRYDRYFQELCWLTVQRRPEQWTADTPERLEQPFLQLFSPESRLSELARVSILLGWHYFRMRPEWYPQDAGLQLLAALTTDTAPPPELLAPAFSQKKILPAEQDAPVGFVEVVQIAHHYGRGDFGVEELRDICGRLTMSNYPQVVNCLIAFSLVEAGEAERGEALYEAQLPQLNYPLDWLTALWCAAWMGYRLQAAQVAPLLEAVKETHFGSTPWVLGELLHALEQTHPASSEEVKRARETTGIAYAPSPLYQLLPAKPTWAHALRRLKLATATTNEPKGERQLRVIWIVDFELEEVYAKEQKLGKTGWSKGRRIKWSELISPRSVTSLQEIDHRAVAGLTTFDGKAIRTTAYYSEDMLYASFSRVLYEIADHPRLFLGEKRRIPIEVSRRDPQLMVTENDDGLLLRFDPPVEREGYFWQKETPTRYRVYQVTEEQANIAHAIGDKLQVPDSERATVEAIVEEVRPRVNVQSTLDLIDENLPTVAGSDLPCFHLLPFGTGYKIELYAKPLTGQAYYFKPGDGLPRAIVVLEQGRHILERQLSEEREAAAAAILSCPHLARSPQENYEWHIEETQLALRILLEMRRLSQSGQASIEHPKGEKLRIVAEAGQNSLALRLSKGRDWFEVEGSLSVDEERVTDLQLLFDHLREQRDNPFIELADGEFLAITDQLRDKVLEMEGLLHQRGKKLSLPTLAVNAFGDLTEDLEEVVHDGAWQEARERMRRAAELTPSLPDNFRAELRDYQQEGYRWMMRLAEWGVGGVLADDMGLGKTVQALAMLTSRADRGPALVIAPASVTRNWRRETERFAPALLPVLIASSTEAVHLHELGAGDFALVSYGLLPFIGDTLEEIEWATIVIDEAQAIKNAATKRAKIVQRLKADFKLATTGTPIENHLGELWSLFRFLNPGLLGSKQAFNEKYNRPISIYNDAARRTALKNLVRPFILRRRKDEVLKELPPKTEVLLNVSLSEEENNLYEAMRRQALKEIAEANERERRFTVLAQLTKLRQAACHPRLVRPDSRVRSSKLELIGETILEILDNGHKALIFSQFVKHLKLVENWVRHQGITYQYLDGSTPGKARETAVNAFQDGQGDLFLISLKAGGTGLNLTAADYVLHLDPWWNPAAEDQASDRAHRIGQQRPVTVYRFVSEGTIEEQIIALHGEKRDLADQILAGTGSAATLGVDEILTLITDQ